MNMMIRKGEFPRVLKISRVTPIKKPRKNAMKTTSYRPISNLQTFEKIIEEILKRRIVNYLEEHNIIRDEHHGGRKHHSTISAKAVLEEAAAKCLDQNKLGVLLSTDLTAAFDTCDHQVLIMKMKYYGMKGQMLKIMKSYLEDRHEFVELESTCSKIRKSLPCSVIQGSRMSGILYTLYTNEVPLLHKLLEDKDWMEKKLKVTKENYSEVDHETVSFVDDMNSMISFKEETEANHYINRFFDILRHYYNLNKLKLNPEKTSVLIVAKPNIKERNKDIRIVTDPEDDDVIIKYRSKSWVWKSIRE